MRLGVIPETLFERVLMRLTVPPTPLADTMVALLLARALMAGTSLGLFDALAARPLSPADVAARCGTDARATEKLLFALAGARYLRFRGGLYSLAPVARRWLVSGEADSLRDAVLQRYFDARLLEHAEEFVRTGRPVDFHSKMTPEEWETYQRGQRAHAVYTAPEVARRTPAPRDPRRMLDVGGAHGHYSAALCRRHTRLRSTILDLPEAVEQSAPLLAAEGLGDRVAHLPGDALTDDLGEDTYDLVFVANLVHHFDAGQGRDLMRRAARALRPGGSCVILEIIRADTPEEAGQIGALTGFFFAVTSASGTWSFGEMADWQRAAGLRPRRPIRLLHTPGYGLQAARKT